MEKICFSVSAQHQEELHCDFQGHPASMAVMNIHQLELAPNSGNLCIITRKKKKQG